MSVSNDPGHFFQTSAALEKQKRRQLKLKNNNGNPLVLPSKILTFASNPEESHNGLPILYTAESGGLARRVNLETRDFSQTFRGHTGPVSAVAVNSNVLYTGSWDKTIRVWDIETRECLFVLEGHTDFVKSLAFVPSLGLLLSGSADASLRVWSHKGTSKPTLLHTLKGHSRGIEDIAIDWSTTTEDQITVFTASSDRTIRKWKISVETSSEDGEPLIIHETSVYAIKVEQDDIWTCSADKTSKRYDRTDNTQETLQHPDFVKDVVVHEGFVYTACSDEDIRQWSLDTMKVTQVYEGHFDEITKLAVVGRNIISASLDGTIRTWDTRQAPKKLEIAKVEEPKEPSGLTEEEERELAELMGEDDD